MEDMLLRLLEETCGRLENAIRNWNWEKIFLFNKIWNFERKIKFEIELK
jgi:hypothetical protein